MIKNHYTEDDVEHFKGLDGVRIRPTMYLGERGDMMIFRALKELVDNAVDEFYAKRNKVVRVYANTKTNEYIVADESAGIPVGLHKKSKVSTLTILFSELHAGAKFQNKAYQFSGGTHGVGAACTNAISSQFQVWTFRDGGLYHQTFEKGKPVFAVKKVKALPQEVDVALGCKVRKGSIIRFVPDQTVVKFGKEIARLPSAFAMSWLSDLANLNKGLTIHAKIDKEFATFENERGLEGLLKETIKQENLEAIGKPFVCESERLDLAVQWTSYPEAEGVRSFVSSSKTKEGGTHLEGFYTALVKSLLPFRLAKDKYTPKDLKYGLVGFLNLRMSGAEFGGQTKNKLVSDVSKDVEQILSVSLTKFWKDNTTLVRKVINRANETKKSSEQFKGMLKALAQVKKSKRSLLPSVLVQSTNCTAMERELYIVEGGSAEGTAKNARSNFQEILPLRGKPPNALRTKPEKLLKNEPVQNILVSLGVNTSSINYNSLRMDSHSLRVGKVMLLADADPDGRHINVLVLTLLWKMLPDLFSEGRVFIVDAPLFFAFFRNKHYYGSDFESCFSQLPESAPKSCVVRAKGWGEVNADALAKVAFERETRYLIKVAPPKSLDAIKWFEDMVGEDASSRKKLIGLG